MKKEDLLFTGGHILTMTTPMTVEAVAVSKGKVRQAGSLSECRETLDPEHKVINLRGRCLMPGFIDAHAHLIAFAQFSQMADLRFPRVENIDDLIRELELQAQKLPPEATVRGFGYDHHKLAEGRHPLSFDLDRVSTDRPVFVMHRSAHHGVANTFMLAQAGIGLHTPDPPGGQIGRNKKGDPNGILMDNALSLVMGQGVDTGNHGPNFHFPEKRDELVMMLKEGSKAYLAAGITTVVDVQVTKREMEAYLAARDSGLLKNRVVMMYLSSYLEHLVHLGLCSGVGDDLLSFGPLKLYADGALTGCTARFSSPYAHDPNDFGFFYHEPEEFKKLILAAHKFGLQTATHAQGDAAIDLVLDAIEGAQKELKRQDVRHRIEHCGVPRDDQFPRLRDLEIWPVTQPRYIYEAGDGVVRDIGQSRGSRMMPLGCFKQFEIPFALSSDSPVMDYRPFLGVSAAVQRITASGKVLGPELSISISDALQAYTIGGASSVHREHDLGSIEKGKWADLVILDRDPLLTPQDKIEDISVIETWVAGQRVYP